MQPGWLLVEVDLQLGIAQAIRSNKFNKLAGPPAPDRYAQLGMLRAMLMALLKSLIAYPATT